VGKGAQIYEHVIQLLPDAIPKRFRPYAIPHKLLPTLRNIIHELLRAGLITTSQATGFCSPAMLVEKKSGEQRLVIDYRHLNKCSRKAVSLVPTISDIIKKMAGKQYFTTLDMASGYWQIALAEDSQDFTTFVLPGDLTTWKWRCLPFGLHSAPSTFYNLVCHVFTDLLQQDIMSIYLDDILVHSDTYKEHIEHLGLVFARLKKHSLSTCLKP